MKRCIFLPFLMFFRIHKWSFLDFACTFLCFGDIILLEEQSFWGKKWFRTAYDVSLIDDNWPQDMFDIVSGNTSRSWERLDAWVLLLFNSINMLFLDLINKMQNFAICSGGLQSHSFELEAKKQGMFYGAPAVITFRIPTKAALQVWD